MAKDGRPSDDDIDLWERATKAVTPLRKARPQSAARAARASRPPAPRRPPAQEPLRAVPPPRGLDPRLARKLARGTLAIDARLDLHGAMQREAHARLAAFVAASRAKGHRRVLVITGKGEKGAGVLRRLVPQWLATAPLRAHIVAFSPAHVRHGGEGALYLQLRVRE